MPEEPDDGSDDENGVIFGTPGNDVLIGGNGNQIIYGDAGNDILTSITGSDQLYGDDGDDTLYGGDSWTRLDGGAGNDKLYGGTGYDVFEFGPQDLNAETTGQIFNAEPGDYIRIGSLWLDELTFETVSDRHWQSQGASGPSIQLALEGNDLVIHYRKKNGTVLPGVIIVKDYHQGPLDLLLPNYPASTAENHAPTIGMSLTDQTVQQGALFQLVLPEALFNDPDGDTLSYSVTLADSSALPSWLIYDTQTRTLSGTPGNSDVGDLSFRVSVTDPDGLSASQMFNLAVTNVNDAPEAVGALLAQTAKQDEAWRFVIPENAFRDIDGGCIVLWSNAGRWFSSTVMATF